MNLLPNLRPDDFGPLLSGCDYGDVFFEAAESLSVRFEDSKVEFINQSSESGMSLRFLRRSGSCMETLQSSVKSLDPASAMSMRERLLGSEIPGRSILMEPWAVWRPSVRLDPKTVSLDEKIALLKYLDEFVRREFPHIRQVSLGYSESLRDLALINSEGECRLQARTAVLLSVGVVVEKDRVLQTGREVLGSLKGYEIIEEATPLKCARAAAERALAKLEAPRAKAGEMPVVLASSAGGTFIHEAIGHSLEADHVQEGTSPAYRGKIGQAVAQASVSVIDDPTLPFARGSFGFDDEGIAARPTTLVKNGVLTDYLHSRTTAMKESRFSNGHGRRESFACRPIPRMSNLYIAPGCDDPKEIVRSLKSGFLVVRMGGGEVNTATGEFVFEVDEGYLVEDGVRKSLVRDANLLGVGPQTLQSIDRVGWDIGWGIGTCGKDGQGVPVSDAQPTLRVSRLLVGGAQ